MTNFDKLNQMKYLKYEIQNSVVILSVNRPDKLNALNLDVLKELKNFLIEIHSDKIFAFKGILLTGEGEKAFIAGADIKEMSSMNNEEALLFGQLGQEVTLLFEKMKVPVIAAVNGFALGGGLELAMSCDFIYAVNSAKMGLPEVSLGLIPGFGGTQRLSKIIGRTQAKEMIYTGKTINGEEALALGIVNRLFNTKAELIKAALETFEKINKNSPLAVSLVKKTMVHGNDLMVEEGLSLELDEFSELFSSNDMKEGTTAFLEKRPANFKGN